MRHNKRYPERVTRGTFQRCLRDAYIAVINLTRQPDINPTAYTSGTGSTSMSDKIGVCTLLLIIYADLMNCVGVTCSAAKCFANCPMKTTVENRFVNLSPRIRRVVIQVRRLFIFHDTLLRQKQWNTFFPVT